MQFFKGCFLGANDVQFMQIQKQPHYTKCCCDTTSCTHRLAIITKYKFRLRASAIDNEEAGNVAKTRKLINHRMAHSRSMPLEHGAKIDKKTAELFKELHVVL